MSARPALSRATAVRQLLRNASTSAESSAAASSSSSSSSIKPLLPPAPLQLPTSTTEAIKVLRETSSPSSGRYCLARLHSRTYLLHPRDILTLPTLKPAQAPGTTLALTRILEVGSRDFAIRSPAASGKELRKKLQKAPGVDASFETIPPWVAKCELTVIEHTKSPLTRTLLKKRRQGYQKTIQNKQGWTRLRVGDIVLGDGVPPAEGAETTTA